MHSVATVVLFLEDVAISLCFGVLYFELQIFVGSFFLVIRQLHRSLDHRLLVLQELILSMSLLLFRVGGVR